MTITGRPQVVNKVITTLKGPLEGKVPISLVRSNLTNNLTKLGRKYIKCNHFGKFPIREQHSQLLWLVMVIGQADSDNLFLLQDFSQLFFFQSKASEKVPNLVTNVSQVREYWVSNQEKISRAWNFLISV